MIALSDLERIVAVGGGLAGGFSFVTIVWKWLRNRAPLGVEIDHGLFAAGMRVFVINKSDREVYVRRVEWGRPDGRAEALIEAPTPPFSDRLLPEQPVSFDVPDAERILQTGRWLRVVTSIGRPTVIGQRALRSRTHAEQLERQLPGWRRRAVRSFLQSRLPGAAKRQQREERRAQDEAISRFRRQLDDDPPTASWPQHRAAQEILEMVNYERGYHRGRRRFTEMLSEVEAIYDERLRARPDLAPPVNYEPGTRPHDLRCAAKAHT